MPDTSTYPDFVDRFLILLYEMGVRSAETSVSEMQQIDDFCLRMEEKGLLLDEQG